MSYILDALKKAEHERRVGQVPSLDGTAVVSDQAGERPRWRLMVGALLLLNAAALVFFLLWLDTTPEVTAKLPLIGESEPPPKGQRIATVDVDGAITPEAPPAASVEKPAPIVQTQSPTPTVATAEAEPVVEEPLLIEPVEMRPTTAAEEQTFEIRKPKVLPPLMASLPDDVRSGLPDLELSVHVFSDDPGKSFVFINDRRYQEGETLKEGPRLESIEKQGVILSYRGIQFLLPGRW